MQDKYDQIKVKVKVKDIRQILNNGDTQTVPPFISQLALFCKNLLNNPDAELTWPHLFVLCKILLQHNSKDDSVYLDLIYKINEVHGEYFFECLELLYEADKYNTYFFGLILNDHNKCKRIFEYLADKDCRKTFDWAEDIGKINKIFFLNFVELFKNDAFVNSIQLLAQAHILNKLTFRYVVYNFTSGYNLRIDECLQNEDSLKTLRLLDSRNLLTNDFFGYILRNTKKCKSINMLLLDENFCKVLRPLCDPDTLPPGIDCYHNYKAIGPVIELVIHYKENLLSLEKHLKDKTFCKTLLLLNKAKCVSKPILDWLVRLTPVEQGSLCEALQLLRGKSMLNKDVLLLFYRFDERLENKNDHIRCMFISTTWYIFSYKDPTLNMLKRLAQVASTAETKDKFAKFQSAWNIYITDKQNGDTSESLNFLFHELNSYGEFTLNQFNYILSTPSIKKYMPTIACLLEDYWLSRRKVDPQLVIPALSYIAIILLLRNENSFDLSKAQELEKRRLTYQDIFHKTYMLDDNRFTNNGADEHCLTLEACVTFGKTLTRLNRHKILSLSRLDTEDANISHRLVLILTIAMNNDYSHKYEYLTPNIIKAINKHPNPKQLLEDYKKVLRGVGKTTTDTFFKHLADHQEIRDRSHTLKQLRYDRTSLFSCLPPEILRHLATFSTFGTPPEIEIKQIIEENIQKPIPIDQIISVNSDVTPNIQTAPRKSVKAAAQ